MGYLKKGTLIGEVQCLFDSDPIYTVEAQSYSTVAIISQQDFNHILAKYNDLRNIIIEMTIHNPYDQLREDFVAICKNDIKYLQD